MPIITSKVRKPNAIQELLDRLKAEIELMRSLSVSAGWIDQHVAGNREMETGEIVLPSDEEYEEQRIRGQAEDLTEPDRETGEIENGQSKQ